MWIAGVIGFVWVYGTWAHLVHGQDRNRPDMLPILFMPLLLGVALLSAVIDSNDRERLTALLYAPIKQVREKIAAIKEGTNRKNRPSTILAKLLASKIVAAAGTTFLRRLPYSHTTWEYNQDGYFIKISGNSHNRRRPYDLDKLECNDESVFHMYDEYEKRIIVDAFSKAAKFHDQAVQDTNNAKRQILALEQIEILSQSGQTAKSVSSKLTSS